MKRIRVYLLLVSLMVIIGCISVGVAAIDGNDVKGDHTWAISKSKTVTNLDVNCESKVVLSLPSAEEELTSDVIFVLDKSSCDKEVTSEALKMLDDLFESSQNSGASIKVGAIQFAGRAVVSCALTPLTEEAIAEDGVVYKGLKEAQINSGTNLQAGLLEAQKMLAADDSVEDNRKYVVVITDGLTRQFIDEDGVLKTIYNCIDSDGTRVWGSPSSWCVANKFQDGEFNIPGGDWDQYFAAVKANVARDKDTYAHDYDIYGATPSAGNTPQPYIPSGEGSFEHALCLDRAIYEAEVVYRQLEAEGYQCYTVFAGTPDTTSNQLGKAFVDALNNGDVLDFDSIQDDIYYLLDAGSQVVDIMGFGNDDKGNPYNFDFINDISSLNLSVGNIFLDKEKIDDNTYGFGKKEDGYQFVLTYYKDGIEDNSECFVWDINVPVSKFAPVQLNYSVKLTDPQNQAGVYGHYDADGSKSYTGLFTNSSAVLYPVDSQGEAITPEVFAKPTVSYEIGELKVSHTYFEGTPEDLRILDLPADRYEHVITTDDSSLGYTPAMLGDPLDEETLMANRFALYGIAVIYPEGCGLENKTFTTNEEFEKYAANNLEAKTGLTEVRYVYNSLPRLNKGDHFSYIIGYPDGNVRPEGQITRAEVAAIFFRLLEDDSRMVYWAEGSAYEDIEARYWYSTEVATLSKAKIITGYPDGTFRGNEPITRGELAAIAARFDSLTYGEVQFSDIQNHWAKNFIIFAAAKGRVKGYPDGTFRPDQMITRAETMELINNVLERHVSPDGLLDGMVKWPDNVLVSVDENGSTNPWYYTAVQEATNSHLYQREEGTKLEKWTKIEPAKDWNALEKEWSQRMMEANALVFGF